MQCNITANTTIFRGLNSSYILLFVVPMPKGSELQDLTKFECFSVCLYSCHPSTVISSYWHESLSSIATHRHTDTHLADVVISISLQHYTHTAYKERTEALSCRTTQLYVDAVLRQTILLVLPTHGAPKHMHTPPIIWFTELQTGHFGDVLPSQCIG